MIPVMMRIDHDTYGLGGETRAQRVEQRLHALGAQRGFGDKEPGSLIDDERMMRAASARHTFGASSTSVTTTGGGVGLLGCARAAIESGIANMLSDSAGFVLMAVATL